jgi:hypothetical protein
MTNNNNTVEVVITKGINERESLLLKILPLTLDYAKLLKVMISERVILSIIVSLAMYILLFF